MDVILMGIITRMECRLVFAINLQDSLDSHGLNFLRFHATQRDPVSYAIASGIAQYV